MKKFQERKIEKLRKEYTKEREFLLWCYEHPDDLKTYDKYTDLYLPMNVCLGHDGLRKVRNKIRSLVIKNSIFPFLNLSPIETRHKMHELGKEFDIIF